MSETTEQKQRKPRWRGWARDIAIAFVLVVIFQWWQTRDIAAGPAPALEGSLMSGERVTIDNYQGKPLLVHFWAEWCPVCRTEEDSIDSLAEDYQVVTVATGSGDMDDIWRYMDEKKLSFPVLVDEDGSAAQRWGVKGVPSSFIVGPDGQIESIAVGYTTEIGLRIRMWLAGRG